MIGTKNEVRVEIARGDKQERHMVRSGLGFLALLRKTELIEYDCKDADCGICLFRVIEGADHLSPRTKKEADFLQAMRCDANERLACQCRIFGDIQLRIEGDPED